jgi:hypothetical protein
MGTIHTHDRTTPLTVHIGRASNLLRDEQPVPPVTIAIDGPCPWMARAPRAALAADAGEEECDAWAKVDLDMYAAEARRIADALEAGLPGGTMHALLCELLRRAPSLFRGSISKRERGDG